MELKHEIHSILDLPISDDKARKIVAKLLEHLGLTEEELLKEEQ